MSAFLGVSALRTTSQVFENAGYFTLTTHKVSSKAVSELVHCCKRIIGLLDKADDFQRDVINRLWRLRSCLLYSLVHYDSAELDLVGQGRSIVKAINMCGVSEGEVEKLLLLTKCLIENNFNPKRNKFFELMDVSGREAKALGIIPDMYFGRATLGWPVSLLEELASHNSGPEIITSRKMLNEKVFDRIILPAYRRDFPMKTDLHNAFRSRELDIVAYDCENITLNYPIALPDVGYKIKSRAIRSIISNSGPTDDFPEERQLDELADEEFWRKIRSSRNGAKGVGSNIDDLEAKVRARYVIYSDGTGCFLPEDQKVTEISDLLEGGAGLDKCDDKLPRKKVGDLAEGDLVVLRLSGSGDALEKVSDGILRTVGKGTLRKDSTDWKDLLRKAIVKGGHDGVSLIARMLSTRGFEVESPRYIWIWTTNLVMCPESEAKFIALIESVAKISQLDGFDAVAYAKKRWELMAELKTFHYKAGGLIRKALLKQLSVLIKNKVKVKDSLKINLPGIDAGELGLIRVSAIDRKADWVQVSRINHRERIEDYLWRG